MSGILRNIFFLGWIYNFLYFWYVKKSKELFLQSFNFVKNIEREMGLRVNIKLITQPIFGDYSYMGRFMGPVFRLIRVFVGIFIILFSSLFCLGVMLVWLFVPIASLYMIFINIIYLF